MDEKYKLTVDTGGTFTDFCLMDFSGRVWIAKYPSTPDDPSRAVLRGAKAILKRHKVEPQKVDVFLHGTTVATNAILENKASRVALLTTKGFRDVIYIGRQVRPHLYNAWLMKPISPVSRDLVCEVQERVDADGSIRQPLDNHEVARIVDWVRVSQIETLAVCLIHAYANPKHELLLQEALQKELPEIFVTISVEILPEFREYERTSTTVLNALVRPVIDRYLGRLERGLKDLGVKGALYIMQSNGGVIPAAQAIVQSARTVLSGPAGGVLAGVYLGRFGEHQNLIAADMGGTSMDVCLIENGQPHFTLEGEVDGKPLRLPMLDMHTVGAGGGSIAWVDSGRALRVGPHSAGAYPGPAAYGLGGTAPTVTDANLILGRLSPGDLAQDYTLKMELAEKAMREKICRPLGLSLEEAAAGVVKVVNAGMIRAMRHISIQKGYDPRTFTLTAFGGAGPLHAVELAREMGMSLVVIPPFPGVCSAWGMLTADLRQDYSQTFLQKLAPGVLEKLKLMYQDMQENAQTELVLAGFPEDQINYGCFLDLRYQGQSHELTLAMPEHFDTDSINDLKSRFAGLHRQYYGFCREEAELEVVTLRLVATVGLPQMQATFWEQPVKPEPWRYQDVYWENGYLPTPVYQREQIGVGCRFKGPALIKQEDSTVVIWPGYEFYGDRKGNLLIRKREEQHG